MNVKVGDQGGHTHELMLSVADQLRHGSGLTIEPYPYPYPYPYPCPYSYPYP